MSVVTINTGAQVTKDPADVKVYKFDWDTNNLAPTVTITTSSWTITMIRPFGAAVALTKDNETVLAGNRMTQVRLSAGTFGHIYEIANKIVTSETPSQTKERSFHVLIANQ